MTIFAVLAGTAASLLWLAVWGIAVAAVFLYWPRRFSGPWTEHERRFAWRRLGGRSLMWALATPLLTVAGFVLLLPPLVELHIGSGNSGPEPLCELAPSPWSTLSRQVSTERQVDAVLCHAKGTTRGALAQAIVTAAADGFEMPASCPAARHVSGTDRVSVELSLVDLAARAYQLTGAILDPGPRMMDPDPWDIMQRSFDARGIATCRHVEGEREGEGKVLRLGLARVEPKTKKMEVAAVVFGDVCAAHPAKVWMREGEPLNCTLQAEPPGCRGAGQRVLQMTSDCEVPATATVLSAGFGKTRIRREGPVKLRFEESGRLPEVFEGLREDVAFVEELSRRDLQFPERCDDCQESSIVRREGADLIIARSADAFPGKGTSDKKLEQAMPREGPFSWQGIENQPTMTCSRDRVVLGGVMPIVDEASGDPSVTYALLSSIVWAANVLATSTCEEVREIPVDVAGAQPLLTAEQMDEAVGSLRRGRDALGMVCLALAIVALALGLLRSVR